MQTTTRVATTPKARRYASIVKDALRDPRNRKSMREVGRNIGYSYEHVRKIVAGEVTFTEEFNNALCAELRLDAKEMWELAKAEKLRAKYGSAVKADLPKDDRVVALWEALSEPEREAWVRVGQVMVEAVMRERESWINKVATLVRA